MRTVINYKTRVKRCIYLMFFGMTLYSSAMVNASCPLAFICSVKSLGSIYLVCVENDRSSATVSFLKGDPTHRWSVILPCQQPDGMDLYCYKEGADNEYETEFSISLTGQKILRAKNAQLECTDALLSAE